VIKQRVDASETTLIADDLNLNAISSTTEGYAPADLKDLVSRAIHQAAMRVNKTLADGPTKLSLSDFEKAKEGFVPASLRDVPLQKSEVVWSDIGGRVAFMSVITAIDEVL
jgi:peroxin-1